MALMHNAGQPGTGSPEIGGEALAPVIPLNPRDNEDFSLPDYQTTVHDSRMQRHHELDCRYGKFWLKETVMTDGTRYEDIIGIPSQRNIGHAALFTPAWFTDHRRGYNIETARDAMKLGFSAVVHSAELNRSIPLSQSAYNMHQTYRDTSGLDEFSTDDAVVLGDSRGAMIGFGFAGYSRRFNVDIPGGLLVDPCIAKRISPRDVRDLPRYLEHVWEVHSLSRQLGRLSLGQLPHYARTFKPTPQWLMRQLRVGVPLFSGEAGNLGQAARDVPLEVLLFTRSAANHHEVWEEIFEGSRVNLTPRTGTHLSIANQRTRETRQHHLARLADELEAA